MAVNGLSESKDGSFAARPAVSRGHILLSVRAFSVGDEFSLLAFTSWISFLRAQSELIPARTREPAGNMSEMGQANSHFVLGLLAGRLVRKFRRREHKASGAILTRSSCCEGHDPDGGGLRVPQLLCPVFSAWPIVREHVVVGDLISRFFQSPNLIRRLRSTWGPFQVARSTQARGALSRTPCGQSLGVGWWGVCTAPPRRSVAR